MKLIFNPLLKKGLQYISDALLLSQIIDHSIVHVIAGSGLSGGGDITADITVSMPDIGTQGVYGSTTTVPVITTDAQGRVSAVSVVKLETDRNVDGGNARAVYGGTRGIDGGHA